MMLTLRGLPPDIAVSDIRSYIHERCAVGRVLLDELSAEAGGTRRVTVATISDADAVTLRHALSGERLGAYTLRVEPYRPANSLGINFRDNGGPGDHKGYNTKTTSASDRFGGNTDFSFGPSGGPGESSGRSGHGFSDLGKNTERDGGRFGGFAGKYRRDGDLLGLGGSNGRGGGGKGGLRENDGSVSGGFGALRGNYVGNVDNLGGHGGSYGKDGSGLVGIRGSKGRGDIGGLSGLGGSYGGDSDGFGGHRGSYGRGGGDLVDLGGNNMRVGIGAGSLGRESEKSYVSRGGFGGHDGQFQKYENDSLGKRYRGEDSINESSSKRIRDSSERDASFGSGGGVTFARSSGRGRGGYSGPDKSRGGGMVGYTDARCSRDAGAFGGYSRDSELGSFGGSSALGPNVIKERSPHSNDNRKVPPWEQNRARDSVQSFGKGSGLISGRVPPWLADRMQVAIEGSRERSRSPAREVSPRRDSAPGSGRGRGGAPLAHRPAERAAPDRRDRRPRSRSPFPRSRGAQPVAGNRREPPFKPPAPRVINPWADPEPAPQIGLGALQIPFLINPLQQFGLDLQQVQPQVNALIALMSTGTQHGQSMTIFENSALNKIQSQNNTHPAINKPFLGNTRTMKGQTFSRKPARPREPNSKSDSLYKLKASYILAGMVHLDKINPRNRSSATSFANLMKSLIEKRLRALTNEDPFKKDLLSIYRNAYSIATDEKTMNGVCKQLSLPEIPIPRKVYTRNNQILETTKKLEHTLKSNATAFTKYVNPNIKVDAVSKKTIEDNVKAENFRLRSAFIIANQLLKPNAKAHNSMLEAEDLRLRPYVCDLIDTELAKFPQNVFLGQDSKSVIRLYHEKMDPDRNRHLIDMAIEKCNSKEVTPYKGKFTIPDEVAITTELWPDLYLKPGEVPPTPANISKSKKTVRMAMWIDYACIVIASEVFVKHKAEYLKHKLEISIDEAQNQVRVLLQKRLRDLVPTDTSRIVSTHSLIALYRRAYPPSTDKELAKGAIEDFLKDFAVKSNSTRKKTVSIKLIKSAADKLTNEVAYGRQISRDERALLTQTQNELLSELQTIIRQRISMRLNMKNVYVSTEEYLLAEYRKAFPESTDSALLESVINYLEKRITQTSQHANEASDQEGSKTDSHVAKPGEVTVSKLEGWREACACKVADEVLHGRVMNGRERLRLSLDAQEKLKAARALVRDQVDEIIAGNKGTLSSSKQLHTLYREIHPPEEDPALKKLVMGMSAAAIRERSRGVEKPEEIAASTMAAWRDSVMCQIVDEVLFGEVLVSVQRKAMPLHAQEKMKLARQIVRKQLEDMLAGEHEKVSSQSDLERLYRTVHRKEEDAALKKRVMRGEREEEPKAAPSENAAVCQRNAKDVEPVEEVPGGPTESIDLTTDSVDVDTDLTTIEIEDDDDMKTADTDDIEDIEFNDDDLEDY